MEINYIGEHLYPGILGRISLSLSFLAALAAALFYLLSVRRSGSGRFRLLGRISYGAHVAFLLVSFLSMYYLIFIHAFEYTYVANYSSKELPLAYLISSMWAGQEGSFMLWALFQAVLGMILLRRSGPWESPTLTVVSLSQFFLVMMVLGWNIAGMTLGSDPFRLMRTEEANAANSFFQNPNYLQLLIDGQGLNPLLENIWMAIHPPLLFLGYAAVLIPFAYAVAGLWMKDHTGWRGPALPWVNFAALTLGVGIIFGGAWAYVSLTFGGFWAWDPVENASLVPWLFVVASLHVLLIARKKPQHLNWAYLFTLLSYVLVLYASYLTRSGILADSSAHAFGDEGKAVPLVVFTLLFLLGPLILLLVGHPTITDRQKEKTSSREFWIFIGSLVLVLSAFQIILTTSIPVLNKLLGTRMAPPTDSVGFYNAWQLPYAILIALLVGLTQYLRYRESEWRTLLREALPSLVTALVVTVLAGVAFPFDKALHYLFLFFLVFMLCSTVEGFFRRKRQQKNLGALITHLGMSLFMLGVLITFSHTKIISRSGKHPQASGGATENQVLIKGDTAKMGKYEVVYTERKEEGKWLHFNLDFLKRESDGRPYKVFEIRPKINRNQRMGNVYEPHTRHLLSKDIYCYITFAPQIGMEDIAGYQLVSQPEFHQHDTLKIGNTILVLDTIHISIEDPKMQNLSITAGIRAIDREDEQVLTLKYLVRDGMLQRVDDTLRAENKVIRFYNLGTQGNSIFLGIYEKGKEYLAVKVIEFPFILVMWAGTIIVFAGLILAIRTRLTGRRKGPAEQEAAGNGEGPGKP